MGLQEIVTWYQKKIGTYDKQQWERTIEQRILHGLTHVPKKTAKLKTELIDVDLVRGSSFPKAKPKHGLVTVTRLALMRLILLPAYSRWWAQQTSPRVFVILLLLYTFQLFNMMLYVYCTTQLHEDVLEHVSASEVLVPTAMMLVLSIIHSQIVSPHSGPSTHQFTRSKSRRVKRTRRRVLVSRSRPVCSDSKSSPDTGSEKTGSIGDPLTSKFTKRVRLRRSSSEDVRRCGMVCTSGKTMSQPSSETLVSEVEVKDTLLEESAVPLHQGVQLQVDVSKPALRLREATPLDDDGFESLNGNGSSENGEEIAEDEVVSKMNIEMAANARTSQGQGRSSLNWIQDEVLSTTLPGCSDIRPKNDHVVFSVSSNDKRVEKNCIGESRCTVVENDSTVAKNCSSDSRDASIVLVNSDNRSEGEALVCATPDKAILSKSVGGTDKCQKESQSPQLSESNILYNTDKIAAPIDSQLLSIENKDVSNPGTPYRNSWVQEVLTCRKVSPDETHAESDTDASSTERRNSSSQRERLLVRRNGSQTLQLSCGQHTLAESSYNSSCCESDDPETVSSPGTGPLLTEGTTSAGEWIGITTNSEECSYSSELEQSDSHTNNLELNDHPFAWEFELSPTVILSPSCAASDRVSCTMWEKRDVKKAELSVLDISSAIIARVESMPENMDYFYGGVLMALLLSALPSLCRLSDATPDVIPGAPVASDIPVALTVTVAELTESLLFRLSASLVGVMEAALGTNTWERTVVLIALFERCVLATLFFFLLAVAERTFKQRFLYAKLFSHLTSFRRARKSELPHFRLNKVRNIKTWLSVRSYLKRRGPQRSVDVIVSAAFLITLLLLSFLSVECLKDSVRLHSQYNMEALVWCLVLGVFLLRFMTLGTKINRKYRNLSVLITEQINLYLQIEQKPNKKEELMVANSVLKLAADLLKELESPFKISGLSANPYLYTITKVVILSALSGVLSEMLGFKLKLHKIKIK